MLTKNTNFHPDDFTSRHHTSLTQNIVHRFHCSSLKYSFLKISEQNPLFRQLCTHFPTFSTICQSNARILQ